MNAPDHKHPPAAQRIDKWLWCARFFKTRTLATKFILNGGMRLTRNNATQRVEKPGFLVRPQDTLAFSIGERLRVIEIDHCALRRGPATEAQTLYQDNSPPLPPKEEKPAPVFMREKGAGRPTKKDRRDLARARRSNQKSSSQKSSGQKSSG